MNYLNQTVPFLMQDADPEETQSFLNQNTIT